MKTFIKKFGAEKWFVVVKRNCGRNRERFAIERGTILERLKTGGPVARSLFSGWVPELSPETLQDEIKSALSANIFAFKPIDASVFLIQPLVVIDKSSGRARLQRTDYSAEFISAHIAQETLDLAQDQLDEVQGQLAAALNISTTRSVAGKVVEDLMHRALSRGMMKLPDVFGTGGAVVTTLELIGKSQELRLRNHDRHRQTTSAVPPAAIPQLSRREPHPRNGRRTRPHPNLPG
ncbi:hypothetical protein DFH09DRAFT_173422 [Mycena vulgaris]|nr:hypothetical protein DFH09DRAFT_173422 [Mycena vulgaris]